LDKNHCYKDCLVWEIQDFTLKIRYTNYTLTTEHFQGRRYTYVKSKYHYTVEDLVKYLEENYSEIFEFPLKEPE
jgi:hypothetical protein